jgi:hypothetical protein
MTNIKPTPVPEHRAQAGQGAKQGTGQPFPQVRPLLCPQPDLSQRLTTEQGRAVRPWHQCTPLMEHILRGARLSTRHCWGDKLGRRAGQGEGERGQRHTVLHTQEEHGVPGAEVFVLQRSASQPGVGASQGSPETSPVNRKIRQEADP